MWTWQATITSLGVIVTNLVALWGQWDTRNRARQSATRAEGAARASEGYTARVVKALEAMAAGPAAAPRRVRWAITRRAPGAFVLQNIGELTAADVTLSGDPSLYGPDVTPPSQGHTVPPGSGLSFVAEMSVGTTDLTITVGWTNPGGSEDIWQYPLPVDG